MATINAGDIFPHLNCRHIRMENLTEIGDDCETWKCLKCGFVETRPMLQAPVRNYVFD